MGDFHRLPPECGDCFRTCWISTASPSKHFLMSVPPQARQNRIEGEGGIIGRARRPLGRGRRHRPSHILSGGHPSAVRCRSARDVMAPTVQHPGGPDLRPQPPRMPARLVGGGRSVLTPHYLPQVRTDRPAAAPLPVNTKKRSTHLGPASSHGTVIAPATSTQLGLGNSSLVRQATKNSILLENSSCVATSNPRARLALR